MTYCPECGSEVAPIDTFCPYCGISLQSIAPANDAVDSPAENSSDAAADKPQISDKTEDLSIGAPKDFGAKDDDEEISLPPKPSVLNEDFNNLPTIEDNKSAVSDFGSDNQAVTESTVENDKPEVIENAGSPAAANQKAENNQENEVNQFPDRDESEQFDVDKVEQKEDANDLEIEDDLKEESVNNFAEVDDFSATIPYPYASSEVVNPEPEAVEGNQPIVEAEKTERAGENSSAPLSAVESPQGEANFPAEGKAPENEKAESVEEKPENKIDIPETPIPETPISTPMYISIQPSKNEAAAGNAAVQATDANESIESVGNLEDKKAEIASLLANESKADRSPTSPNIGFGDTDGKKAAKLKPLNEGAVLNSRYEIVRKIGGGGMGAVYLASDQNLGGVLRAVKEMVQSYIEDSQQEKAINDFRRESMLLSSLEHPAIPTIFDYFFDDKEGRFYLVMKYISGGDLAARLRSSPEGRIDESSVTEWAIQIADVLDYLHNRPMTIIYRDLKPSNIMIDGNTGRAMLIDFGIARSVNKEEKGVTAIGTMGYAPPELFSGNVEPRSDIYSLGSTMFHLLTGADPQSNPLLIFDFAKNPRPRQINSTLSDQMEQILMRAVEYNSTQRFGSAAEMRDVLTAHLENLRKGTVTYGVSSPTAGVQMASTLPVFCGFCGQQIVATDMFCPFCGAQQPIAGQSTKTSAPPVYSMPKASAHLILIGTNELDAPKFSIEKETNLVGRRDPMSNIFPEVDLSKYDPQTKISRKHARIWRESDSYMLEDLGSSNGTVLMSQTMDSVRLLPRQPQKLSNGDKIKVGDTTLHFFIG